MAKVQELSVVEIIQRRYGQAHEVLLKLVDGLPEGVATWHPEHGPQCIAWQLWHVARWDDYLAEALIGRNHDIAGTREAAQIWKQQGLAAKWGFDPERLGLAEAGTNTDAEQAASLQWLAFSDVVEYANAVFPRVEDAIGILEDRYLTIKVPRPAGSEAQGEPGTYGENLLGWLEHVREHVGTIQALRGQAGLPGLDM